MHLRTLLGLLLASASAFAAVQTTAASLWTELQGKRAKLTSFHQEFDISQTYTTSHGVQSSKRQIVLDAASGQWREKSVTGSGTHLRIFDGKDVFWMEEGGEEFVRTKHRSKDDDPAPSSYTFDDPDWSKAVEVERKPCAIPGIDHQCVLIEVPLKKWTRNSATSKTTRLIEGSARILFDAETGLLISSRMAQLIDDQRGGYQSDTTYLLKRLRYGAPAEASLFKLPSEDLKEVKELPQWNAAKIKKLLAGKPAPDLTVTDIQGKPVALSAFKGKTVLLDFWTTWCPPCRADGPALDKLYRKYGEKDLMIVGFSVSEERAIVEKFLKEHPHSYPIVLTAENEMPRPYQIGVFPTYIVINADGTVSAAVEGDQGFADLQKRLKKAGMEIE